LSSVIEVAVGIVIGLTIGKSFTMLGEWLDRAIEDRSDRISRQRAERSAIRRDMDLHPVEKGEVW
jgi:hypothetical protein